MLNNIIQQIMPWLLTSGLRIVFIVVGLYILHHFVKIATTKVVRGFVREDTREPDGAKKNREETLTRVIHASIYAVIVAVGAIMILGEIGINTGPLIAAAGIGGLAFGFGGQYLIKDIINGTFIILENQFKMGDFVCFGETCGLVEDVNLRRTLLRDLDGVVHYVPNGNINTTSNMSKQFARVNLDIGVAYDTNLEHLISTVNKVGDELAKDTEWKGKIKGPPQFLRIERFGDSAMTVKILGETQPLEQWAVAGELRKRLKIAFDKEGIKIS
jgi:small conductance mechanosensitive channel